MNKKLTFLIYFVTIGFGAAVGFACGIMLSRLVDTILEIKIANISDVGVTVSFILFAGIIAWLLLLIRWKSCGLRIFKEDIYVPLFIIILITALAFVWSLICYLGIRFVYFYAIAGILTIGLFLFLAKHLAKTQRKKGQPYYYRFEFIFMLGLAIGLLVGLIF